LCDGRKGCVCAQGCGGGWGCGWGAARAPKVQATFQQWVESGANAEGRPNELSHTVAVEENFLL